MTTKELLALVAHLFATGYGCGHHATVEGYYTDVLPCDLDTYFEDHDAVQEAFAALCAEVEAKDERIAQQDATIARLTAALATIRASTFRNATTLRGMADYTLTQEQVK